MSSRSLLATVVIITIYTSWRISLANRMPITDCDEVYNYWEPLHFLLYGSGQQTWEYAHQYALRTYAFLMPLKTLASVLPTWLLPFASSLVIGGTMTGTALPGKVAVFVLLRSSLAFVCSACELYWLYSLVSSNVVSLSVAAYTAVLMLTCTGMNHAAAALLPSSVWMWVFLLSTSLFLQKKHKLFVITAVTATLATGWPFGVVVLIPTGLRVLYKEHCNGTLVSLMLFVVMTTVVIQGLISIIDYQYYGSWAFPTMNIFTYNAAGGGDELYGVEPASFYVKNLLLNLNFMAPLGLLSLPISYFSHRRNMDLIVIFLPVYLWFAITVPRPHKEERFMFPIYPALILGAVWTIDATCNACGRIEAAFSRHKQLSITQRCSLHAVTWIPIVLTSLCRTAALSKYYAAPLSVYGTVATMPPTSASYICTCGEWYRYPSSFYLPPNSQLGFLRSSFTGQLPQAFSEHGSKPESMTVLQPFNDRNLEETDRYVSAKDCAWLVDLGSSDCLDLFSPYSLEIVKQAPFLSAQASSALHRILYIPFLHEYDVAKGKVAYDSYTLYKVKSN